MRKVIALKYINTRNGLVFEDENEKYVLNLIKTKPQFQLYEEDKPIIEEKVELEGIESYIPTKPRKKKPTKK